MSTLSTIAGTFAAFVVISESRADELAITEKPGNISESVVTVDATPAEVYAAVTDYARWPALFTDIISVNVQAGSRRDAKVRFKSRALQHTVTVLFDNEPDRAIRFRGVEGPPGGRARGEFLLAPLDNGRRTQITAHLYMEVVGLPGVFIKDQTIRTMRRAKLRADLVDVARRFPTSAQARS